MISHHGEWCLTTETRRHGGTEARRHGVNFFTKTFTEEVIGAAIEVHRTLGSGLLESAYEECRCHELHLRGLAFRGQVPLPVDFKGIHLDYGNGMDALLEDSVILELKCVEHVLPVHEAQLLTHLKLTG